MKEKQCAVQLVPQVQHSPVPWRLAGRYATDNGELRERLSTDRLHLQSVLRLP